MWIIIYTTSIVNAVQLSYFTEITVCTLLDIIEWVNSEPQNQSPEKFCSSFWIPIHKIWWYFQYVHRTMSSYQLYRYKGTLHINHMYPYTTYRCDNLPTLIKTYRKIIKTVVCSCFYFKTKLMTSIQDSIEYIFR